MSRIGRSLRAKLSSIKNISDIVSIRSESGENPATQKGRTEGVLARWQVEVRRLMRSVILACVLFVFVHGLHGETRDGNWWMRQNESTKIYYVLGSIDRTMLTGSIDPKLKREVIGEPQIGEIVAHLNAFYYREDRRAILVQNALPVALYEIAQSARK